MKPIGVMPIDELNKLNALARDPAAEEQLALAIRDIARRPMANTHGSGGLQVGGFETYQSGYNDFIDCRLCEEVIQADPATTHPGARVVACLNLLHRMEQPKASWDKTTGAARAVIRPEFEQLERATPRLGRAVVQACLSRTLVEYPILAHPHMVFRFGLERDRLNWINTHQALAYLSYGSLPARAHGISEDDLFAFASNPSVRTGLHRESSDSSAVFEHARSKQPLLVAGSIEMSDPGAMRGAYWASLLELNGLLIARGARPLADLDGNSDGVGQSKDLNDLAHSCMGRVVSTLLSGQPIDSTGTDEASFAAALRASPAVVRAGVRAWLMSNIDEVLFRTSLFNVRINSDEPAPLASFAAAVDATSKTIEFWVNAGLAEDQKEAARLLASCVLEQGRDNPRVPRSYGPNCAGDAALGFLAALQDHGVRVDAARLNEPFKPSHETYADLHRLRAKDTWIAAHQAHEVRISMTAVLAGGAEASSAPTKTARARV